MPSLELLEDKSKEFLTAMRENSRPTFRADFPIPSRMCFTGEVPPPEAEDGEVRPLLAEACREGTGAAAAAAEVFLPRESAFSPMACSVRGEVEEEG